VDIPVFSLWRAYVGLNTWRLATLVDNTLNIDRDSVSGYVNGKEAVLER